MSQAWEDCFWSETSYPHPHNKQDAVIQLQWYIIYFINKSSINPENLIHLRP